MFAQLLRNKGTADVSADVLLELEVEKQLRKLDKRITEMNAEVQELLIATGQPNCAQNIIDG